MEKTNNDFEKIINICINARQELLIGVPWWWDDEAGRAIRNEAIKAINRGVSVKVFIRPAKQNQRTINKLRDSGAEVTLIPTTHFKAICSEEERGVLNANFFNKDTFENINFATFSRDESDIRETRERFKKTEVKTYLQLDGPEIDTRASDLIEEPEIYNSIPHTNLNPLQSYCARHALYGEDNLLVIAPTGAGKTDVGILGLLSAVIKHDAKGVWLVPSRALAKEVTQKIKKLNNKNIRVLSLVGGEEAPNELLTQHNIWICTTEKFESIFRRKSASQIVDRIYTIVIDEVHLLADKGRGALIESLIARIKEQAPYPRIIGLSATLENDEEFAGWFNARLLKSKWKPSILNKEILAYKADTREKYFIKDERRSKLLMNKLIDIKDNPRLNGATLIFCRSKAKCLRHAIELLRKLKGEEELLQGINTKQEPSNEAKLLLQSSGIGIHYSGYKESHDFLNKFNNKKIEFLFSTTGLAQGVNTSAKTVIISETTIAKDTPLSLNTVNQMLGRAGRKPGEEGFGIIICPEYELEKWSEGIEKSSEVKSVLSAKLIEIILAEIALNNIKSSNEAKSWYLQTFQAFCNQDSLNTGKRIDETISYLLKEGLIKLGEDGGLIISTFGEACIRLMTDIECSIKLIKSLRTITSSSEASWNEMQLIRAVALSMNSNNYTGLENIQSYKDIAEEFIKKYKINKEDETPKEILNLIAIDLLLYDRDRIFTLPKELDALRNRCLYYVPENVTRYFALIHQTILGSSSPWICMCANDISKRIKWHSLNPKPGRGSSRIIGFIESLTNPLEPTSTFQQAWEASQKKMFLHPGCIPKNAPAFSFCRDKAKAKKAINNIFNLEDLDINYVSSIDSIRIANFPESTREIFARVDSSCGTTQKLAKKATAIEIKLPITNKLEEVYSVLIYASTPQDKILFSNTQSISKSLVKTTEGQLEDIFVSLLPAIPEVYIARRKKGIRSFLREKILGPFPDLDEFSEAIAKKDYLSEISAIFRLSDDTDSMTAWRINDLINQVISLKSSMDRPPFEFQSVANTLRNKSGTILEREMVKAAIGINCGLDMGLAYNPNGGSIYALYREELSWSVFQNLPSDQSRNLHGIYPINLSGSIASSRRPTAKKPSKTPDYSWSDSFSFPES